MDTIVMVAQIILSLSILVGLHEMGHLLAAKAFGMRVEQFSIGFPPKLFGFKYGETEYALSLIPLGGYVKISGMIDESLDTEAMKEEPKEWEFRSKPAWQRLIVMLGGIVINVITGIAIFVLLFFIWGEQYMSKDAVNENGGIIALELAQSIGLKTGDQIVKINGEEFTDYNQIINPSNLLEDEAYYTVNRKGEELDIPIPGNFIENFQDKSTEFISVRFPSQVDSVYGGIAEKLELQEGDKFIEVDGTPLAYFDELKDLMQQRSSDTISFKIDRSGEILSYTEYLPADSTKIGFSINTPKRYKSYEESQSFTFGESVPKGTKYAFGVVFMQLKAFSKMFKGDLNPAKSLSGPIGIAQAYGTEWDWYRFWRMTGLLSMILAFMNLLPIPALDGGHVAFLTAEIISGRKPSDKFMENAQKVGMLILLSLMVFIFANDILKAFDVY